MANQLICLKHLPLADTKGDVLGIFENWVRSNKETSKVTTEDVTRFLEEHYRGDGLQMGKYVMALMGRTY